MLRLLLISVLFGGTVSAQTPDLPKVFASFQIDRGQTPDSDLASTVSATADASLSSAFPTMHFPIIQYNKDLYLLSIKPIGLPIMLVPYRDGEQFGSIRLFWRGLTPNVLVPLGSVDEWGEGSQVKIQILITNYYPQFTSARVVTTTKSLPQEISGISSLGVLPLLSFKQTPDKFLLYFNGRLLEENKDFTVYPNFNFLIVTPRPNSALARVDENSPKDVFTLCTNSGSCSSGLADFPPYQVTQDQKTQIFLNQIGTLR